MERLPVYLNASAGAFDRDLPDRMVERTLESASLQADIRYVKPEGLQQAIREKLAEKPDAIVVGGGDGTISAAAAVLAGTGVAMGVLPAGTLNHFAKDLRIPLDLEEAARLISRANVRAVDIAEVNGRYFINNSSIGLYPRMVRIRDEQRFRIGRGKWPAMLSAIIHVFRRPSCIDIGMRTEGERALRQAPFVFIGNNVYRFDLFTLGGRDAVDTGVLSLYTAKQCGRFSLLSMAVRAIAGRLDQGRDFEIRTLSEVSIEVSKPRIRVACDGEITIMEPPLRYRIHPGALSVIAPGR